MSAIGRLAASLVSGVNDNTFALANLNVDFSLVKIEAPVEYQGLRSALSRSRVKDAEQGPLHRTARKLGALFEQILPPIKKLAEVYGKRVSEIISSEKLSRKVCFFLLPSNKRTLFLVLMAFSLVNLSGANSLRG